MVGGLDAVKTGAAAAGLTVTVIEPVLTKPLALVAVTTKVAGPGVVGVPASTPVLLFRFNPAGRLPVVTENVAPDTPTP